MEIIFRHKGDFSKVTSFFEKLREAFHIGILDKYGRMGVAALAAATPKDTGKTAASWSYEISQGNNSAAIIFSNSNVNKGVNIAMILQYGHGTGTGGYVAGIDYINPAIRPVFEQMAKGLWEEVIRL